MVIWLSNVGCPLGIVSIPFIRESVVHLKAIISHVIFVFKLHLFQGGKSAYNFLTQFEVTADREQVHLHKSA